MAIFEDAVQVTLIWEGGWSENPADPGGATFEGISRRNWPNWAGWPIIDGLYGTPNWLNTIENSSAIKGLVVQFYHDNFWQYDSIEEQPIANKLFDLSVNIGTIHAIKIVQGALNLPQDGIMGPHTLASINGANGSLIQLIRMAAENYHTQLAAANPNLAEFLTGWLRRDAS
jgi:lysozyme family protein